MPAAVAVTYLLPDGSQVRQQHTVGATQRFTIWVDQADARLANTAVSMVVESIDGVPIVVERSMWWPGDSRTWTEAHNAPGATVTGVAWAVADGEVSGAPSNRATYYLVANPGAATAQVKVTLLFDDGSPVLTRTFPVVANSRFGVSVRDEFPGAVGQAVRCVDREPRPDARAHRCRTRDVLGRRWRGVGRGHERPGHPTEVAMVGPALRAGRDYQIRTRSSGAT